MNCCTFANFELCPT